MTYNNTEHDNIKFNRVRLPIEGYLKTIDMTVLKYIPELVNIINSGYCKFLPFQRAMLCSNDIKKYKNVNISKFIINEPVLAFITTDVVLDSIKSDIHNKGSIFRTNQLLNKMFKNRFLPECFTKGSIDIVEVIENNFDIVLSSKDIDTLVTTYDDILSKVSIYTEPIPNGIFDFDYSRNYVDLVYVDDIYCFRYNEAYMFLEQNKRLVKNYE